MLWNFLLGTWASVGFRIHGGSWNQSPTDNEGQLYINTVSSTLYSKCYKPIYFKRADYTFKNHPFTYRTIKLPSKYLIYLFFCYYHFLKMLYPNVFKLILPAHWGGWEWQYIFNVTIGASPNGLVPLK